jgi:collagenase-like PrtC family protease
LEELIKSRWIRPEDLKEYKKYGIERFKIGTRYKDTKWLLNCAKAYSQNYYNGNLLDLLTDIYLPIPELKFKEVIYIDNKKLNKFLKFFKNKDCENKCDGSCNYCRKIAEKVIIIKDKEYIKKYLFYLKKYQNGLLKRKYQY